MSNSSTSSIADAPTHPDFVVHIDTIDHPLPPTPPPLPLSRNTSRDVPISLPLSRHSSGPRANDDVAIPAPLSLSRNSSGPNSLQVPMPLHLMRTVSDQSYSRLLVQLMEMGFEYEQVEVALMVASAQSVTAALDVLVTDGPPRHMFVAQRDNSNACFFCNLSPEDHSVTDSKGVGEMLGRDASGVVVVPDERRRESIRSRMVRPSDADNLPFPSSIPPAPPLSSSSSFSSSSSSSSSSHSISVSPPPISSSSSPVPVPPPLPAPAPASAPISAPVPTPPVPDVVLSSPTLDDSSLCPICFDTLDTSTCVTLERCKHPFCAECIKGFISVKVNDNDLGKIKCPGRNCQEVLSEAQVRKLVPPELMEKYEKFNEQLKLSLDPSVRWCPSPDCNTALKGSEKKRHLICSKCKYEMCWKCSAKWHGRKTCDEIIDEGYNEWARGQNVQHCPKCRIRVEKDSGCNHMTCSRCRHQWCWLCRGTYSSIHFSPINPFGCPGLQSGSNEARHWPWWKRIGLRFLLLLAILVAIPLGIVFAFPLWFTVQTSETSGFRRNMRNRKCYKCMALFLLFMVGIILNVFVIPLAAICVIPVGIAIGIKEFRRRRR